LVLGGYSRESQEVSGSVQNMEAPWCNIIIFSGMLHGKISWESVADGSKILKCSLLEWIVNVSIGINILKKRRRPVFRFPEHIIDYTDCAVNLNDQV
jgi:hypothetical protein